MFDFSLPQPHLPLHCVFITFVTNTNTKFLGKTAGSGLDGSYDAILETEWNQKGRQSA